MKRGYQVLIAVLAITNLVTISALENSTNLGEMAVKKLFYNFRNLGADALSQDASANLLSIDSALSQQATSRLAVFLQPFASLGVLKDVPLKVSVSESSLNFIDNCSKDIPKDGILYFGGKITLDKNEKGLLVFGDQNTQSLDLVFFDEKELCDVILKFSVRLSGGYISIRKMLIDPNLPPISNPVHTTMTDPENVLAVDRFSNVYLMSATKSLVPKFLGQVLPLNEDSVARSGGVKSIAFLDGTLYTSVAYTTLTDSCAKLQIFSSKMDFLRMRLYSKRILFEMPRCFRETIDLNLLASGGRIHINSDKKMLFTVGNAEIWNGSETTEYVNDVGIVIEINLTNGQYRIVSSGHRNPQGISTCKEKIFVSEQGPDGGDEINDVTDGGDFGWPINSYGEAYNPESERRFLFWNSYFRKKTITVMGAFNCSRRHVLSSRFQ